jgi:YfiH family protein
VIEVPLAHGRVVFSTRSGGESKGAYASLNVGRFTDDDAEAVESNIEILRKSLGLERLQLLHQVHSSLLHKSNIATLGEMPDADAAITDERLTGLLATGADCPPVALVSAERAAIVHCGWRPVAAKIIETVAAEFAGEEFEAAIGPGICQRHFEVGPEVIEALGEDGAAAADGRQLDLAAVITTRLQRFNPARIQNVDRCTYCEPDQFFSHRRDGGITGRQAGVVWLS